MSVDLIFFGAHPDDVEWGAGGTLLLLQKQHKSFAIVDLTQGEMGSRGTLEERTREARTAAEFLGAATRENLNMPDCGLMDAPEARRKIAGVIRKHRPKLVIAPFWEDRHPDHAAAGLMVRNSALYCALKRSEDGFAPHKPAAFLFYLLHNYQRPSFVVNISDVYQQKLELLRLHHSQFSKSADELGLVPLGVADYLFGLESRDRFFGSLVGVRHGEAMVSDRPLQLTSISQLLSLAG